MATADSRPRSGAARLIVVAVLAAVAAPARPASLPAQEASAGQAAAGPGTSAADRQFISGMLVHHAQAILMAGWAPTHGASPAVRELCRRITISQRDEMATMERWLREHHQPLPDTAVGASLAAAGSMPGMAMSGSAGSAPAMMPGMLTREQLLQLDSAQGPAFDRAFLAGMIQHHRGALTMVAQYDDQSGAGQDPFVFQFASDVNGDQTAEIDRMSRMLAAMPSPQRIP